MHISRPVLIVLASLLIGTSNPSSAETWCEAHAQTTTQTQGECDYLVAMDKQKRGELEDFVRLLQNAEKQGYVPAMAALATVHHLGPRYYGISATFDRELSERYAASALNSGLTALADSDDREAQYQYALMLRFGVGGKTDRLLSREYFLRALENGHTRAALQLSMLAFESDEEVDDCEGFWFARKAMERGHTEAFNLLGLAYIQGKCAAEDDELALEHWMRAAQRGLAVSQYNVGLVYERGRGVDVDYETALKWYRLAAEQGNGDAQYRIGFFYAAGLGVAQSNEDALKWYRRASKNGVPHATRALGRLGESTSN